MYAQISPCLPAKHKTFFGCFLLRTTVDCCGYTLSPSYPQLWYFIPLSFFRLGNLRWPFCLRCFQEIHCNSVRNLRPLHTPPIDICPVSFTILCSDPPPLFLQQKKQNKNNNKKQQKQSKKLTVYLYTGGNRHTDTCSKQFISIMGVSIGFVPSIHTIPEIELVCYHICLPQPLGHCCHLLPYRNSNHFFKWQASSQLILSV